MAGFLQFRATAGKVTRRMDTRKKAGKEDNGRPVSISVWEEYSGERSTLGESRRLSLYCLSIVDDEIITVEFVRRLFWRPAARCLANLSAPSPGTAERNLYASAAQCPKPDSHRLSADASSFFVIVPDKPEDREPCSLCKWRTVSSRISAFSSLLMSSPSVCNQ